MHLGRKIGYNISMVRLKAIFIRIATALIPSKGVRKRIRRRLLDSARDERCARLLPVIRARYAAHEAECRAKLARGERLKVAFLVCDASMFSGESVYRAMLGDARFEPFIAVAPRVSRGDEFMRETMDKTFRSLSARYGDEAVVALCGQDLGQAREVDADVVFSTVIYEDQSLPQYTVEAMSRRALVAILYYGYGGLFVSNEKKTPFLPNIVFAWRYFVSNEATRDMAVSRNSLLAGNTVASGYCKMDRLAAEMEKVVRAPGARKKVIVCSHHTIDAAGYGTLALSTFLANADALLRLPGEFPEVDFVFRPHPLLFVRLATPKWWGPERTAEYRAKLEAHPNVEFQQGGDYFATFAESDAMIHDCGSFLAEYFYTGRPQCFMLREGGATERQLLPFSRRLMDYVYKVRGGGEISDFVRDVVVGGRDPLTEGRAAFAASEVCVNHPDATGRVVDAVMKGIEKGEL